MRKSFDSDEPLGQRTHNHDRKHVRVNCMYRGTWCAFGRDGHRLLSATLGQCIEHQDNWRSKAMHTAMTKGKSNRGIETSNQDAALNRGTGADRMRHTPDSTSWCSTDVHSVHGPPVQLGR
jgi:hypothetical protein